MKLFIKRNFVTICICVLIILCSILLGTWFINKVVKPFCDEYESSRIELVLNNYMSTINNNKWNDSIASAAIMLKNDFQSEQEVVDIVKQYLQRGDITQKMSGVGDVTKYALSSTCYLDDGSVDVQQIGEIEFNQDKNHSSSLESGPQKLFLKLWPFSMATGFYPNSLCGEHFDFSFLKNTDSLSVEIPEGFKLYVGNTEVSEDYITERDIKFPLFSSLYDTHPNIIKKVKYELPSLVGDVSYTIKDSSGNLFISDKTKTDLQYASPVSNSELNEITDFINGGFISAYLWFWGTKNVDVNYPDLIEFVQMDSKLQQDMYTYTLDAATWVHTTSITINSSSISNVVSIGDGLFVVTFKANTTAYAPGKDAVTEDCEKTVLLARNEEGQLKAIDRL